MTRTTASGTRCDTCGDTLVGDMCASDPQHKVSIDPLTVEPATKCRDCGRSLEPADDDDPEGPWVDEDGERECDVTFRDHWLSSPNEPVAPQQVRVHLAAVCKEAGLGVMAEVFDIVLDREHVTDEQMLKVTSKDVTDLYELWLGPAIDKIERHVTQSTGTPMTSEERNAVDPKVYDAAGRRCRKHSGVIYSPCDNCLRAEIAATKEA